MIMIIMARRHAAHGLRLLPRLRRGPARRTRAGRIHSKGSYIYTNYLEFSIPVFN